MGFAVRVFKMNLPEFGGEKMEFRSFVAGMLFLIGAEILMPILGIKVDIVLPYAPYSPLVAGIGCIVLSYFVFRNG